MKQILKAFLLGTAISAMSLLAGCSDAAYEEEQQVTEKTTEENNSDSARCGWGGNGTGRSGNSGYGGRP